jgi:Xaa-Pro aminopeptidase
MKLFDQPRAKRLMAAADVDLALASSKVSVSHLADCWDDETSDDYGLWYPDLTYFSLCGVAAAEGTEPFLVVPTHERTSIEARDLWIKDRRYWGPGFYVQQWTSPRPEPGDPIAEAAAAIRERGLAGGRIGIERRYFPIEYFERLRSLLPKASWVDVTPMLANLRSVKTPEEIRRLRTVCERTARAWRTLMPQLRAGMTERDLRWEMIGAFADQGIAWSRGTLYFGPAGVRLTYGAPASANNQLRVGNFVRTDIVGRYEGYLSDMSRVVAFGPVSPAMERIHAQVLSILKDLLGFIRPGLSARQVRAHELALYEGIGVSAVVPYTGHGIGLAVHESPYLDSENETILESGMVLAIEPSVMFRADGDVNVVLEDDILLTDTGCERLTSEAPLDLHLAGVTPIEPVPASRHA